MPHQTNRLRHGSLGLLAAGGALMLAGACGPGPAGAGSTSTFEATDQTGDITDAYDDTPVDAPDYVDVSRLSVRQDGAEIVLTLDLLGDLPTELDDSRSTIVIGFVFDMEGGETPDFVAKIRSEDGWRPTLSSLALVKTGSTADFPGSAEIAGGRVTVRLERAAIGDPDSFRLKAAVRFEDYPDPSDPLVGVSALDGVPEPADLGLEVRLD